MRLELSQGAAADLAEIADFTVRHWGEEAADEYVNGLLALFSSDGPPKAGVRSADHGSLKRVAYRSHFIFFEGAGDHILIVRVLHRRRDVFRHLR